MENLQNKNFQNLISELNNEQLEAVNKIDGPVLIIAGPGTGKTKLISTRVANILEKTDASPENILCLTFTDAASQEMRSRIREIIGLDANKVGIYTYHAFCNNVILSNPEYFGDLNLQLANEVERQSLIREVLDNIPSDNILYKAKGDRYNDMQRLLNLFSDMKKEDWTAEQIEIEINKLKKEEKKFERAKAAAKLFEKYNQTLQKYHRFDYDDMILFVIRAFQKNNDLLLKYQEKFQYIMIDEFQDTNGSQFELLELLLNYWDSPNILCVGDDDQCIFEFQGARIFNILKFQKKYNPKIITLTKNYRSSQNILSASNSIIGKNKIRFVAIVEGILKNIFSAKKEPNKLNINPVVQEYSDAFEEAADIVNQIENQNVPLSQTAILFREFDQSQIITELLRKKNIPFKTKRAQNLTEHPVYKMVFTMLAYFVNELNLADTGERELFKIMHFNWFGIDPNDVARLSNFNSRARSSIRMLINDKKKLKTISLNNVDAILNFESIFKKLFSEVYTHSPVVFLKELVNKSGLLKFILSQDEVYASEALNILTSIFQTAINESRIFNISSTRELYSHFKKIEEMNIRINVESLLNSPNGVTLTTCHSAKGTEFENVYLIGCTQNKWKKKKGSSNFSLPLTLFKEDKEDENNESSRRLFYVALTRAKHFLHISYYRMSNDSVGKISIAEPSQFITELEDAQTISKSEILKINPDQINNFRISYLSSEANKTKYEYDKELIDNYIEGLNLSPSTLNALIKCGNAFYFDKILKVYSLKNESLILGSAVHAGLSLIAEPNISVQKMYEYFKNNLNSEKIFLTEDRIKRVDTLGKKILEDYFNFAKPSLNNILRTELSIQNFVYNGIKLNGKIDRIDSVNEETFVFDYKTSKPDSLKKKEFSAPNEKMPNGGEYWRQLAFYKLLINLENKITSPQKGGVIFLERDNDNDIFTIHQIPLTDLDIDELWRITQLHLNKLKNYELDACAKKECDWCNFTGKIKTNLFE